MATKKEKLEFVPNPENTNKGTERGTRMLENTVRAVGPARSGVAASNGKVIAGNHALQAMKDLDIPIKTVETDGTEWVMVVRTDIKDESDPKAIQLAIADNRVSEINYNPDVSKIIAQSKVAPLDVLYSPKEIKALVQGAITKDREAKGRREPETHAQNYLDLTPRCKVGEIWKVGGQRIICGDAADPESWNKLLGDETINLCITSPPYAKQRKYDEQSGFRPIDQEHYSDWFKPIQTHLYAYLANDGSYFLNIRANIEEGCRSLYGKQLLLDHVYEWGWMFRDDFVWTHHGTPARVWNNFKNQWEPIYHFSQIERIKFRPESVQHESKNIPAGPSGPNMSETQGSGKGIGNDVLVPGMAYPGNVLRFNQAKGTMGFPAAFPIELPTFFIRSYTDPKDLVFDPFCGAGTTLMAAEIEQRRGAAIELSPKAVEVALLRLEELTETKAVKT